MRLVGLRPLWPAPTSPKSLPTGWLRHLFLPVTILAIPYVLSPAGGASPQPGALQCGNIGAGGSSEARRNGNGSDRACNKNLPINHGRPPNLRDTPDLQYVPPGGSLTYRKFL